VARLFDPFDPEVYADPYPVYARLRAEAPLYRGEGQRFWTLSRHADVQAALADHGLFSSAAERGGIGITPYEGGKTDTPDPVHPMPPGNLILMDPPRHGAFRGVIQRRFLRKHVARWAPSVERVANELIDGFARSGRADVLEGFSTALPALVFAEVLGIPASHAREFAGWAAALTTVPTTPEGIEAHDAAMRSTAALFADLLPEKRRRPEDDLLSEMAAATGEGLAIRAEEFVGLAISMLIAGNDTTSNLLASGLWLLERHPEQRAHLVREPAAMESAVEEILRYEPPVHGLARVATRDVVLHGRRVAEGEKVLLLFASANRDERVFDAPERFDALRRGAPHLSFGFGVHHCVGLHLGRLETRVALRAFLARIPEYRVPRGGQRWRHLLATRQMASLAIEFAAPGGRAGPPAPARAPARFLP